MKKILLLLSIIFIACDNKQKENNEEWVSLIQQDSMDGWHYYQDDGNKTGWDIKDGVLTFTSANASGNGDKSLVSDKDYTNFKIYLEWKVSPGSNSGFFWGVQEDEKYEFPYVLLWPWINSFWCFLCSYCPKPKTIFQ